MPGRDSPMGRRNQHVPTIEELAGYTPEQLSAYYTGVANSQKYSKYFSAAPEGLLDMVQGGFGDYREAMVGNLREQYVPQYIMSKKKTLGGFGKAGMASSGFQNRDINDMQRSYINRTSAGMFDIEQDVIGKQQEAKSLLDQWFQRNQDNALRIKQMRNA